MGTRHSIKQGRMWKNIPQGLTHSVCLIELYFLSLFQGVQTLPKFLK